MTNDAVTGKTLLEAPPRVSETRRFMRVFFGRGLVIFGAIIVIAFILMAIFSPWLVPYDPFKTNARNILAQPGSENWLGTDAAGRDILSRVIYGSRYSLFIGLTVSIIASTVGTILGLVAGYFGSWTHNIIMRIVDGLMAFPMILLCLIIAAMLGAGIKNVIVALGVGMMPGYVRLVCAQVLSVREYDYILAARSIGSSSLRVMFRHIFPNIFPAVLVLTTMLLGGVILTEASLSFLGIGIDPKLPSWGSMISYGRENLVGNPILSFAPGAALMLVIFAFNMIGDGLRDALDPRLRGTL